MSAPHALHRHSDEERSLDALERMFANAERALEVNGYRPLRARTLLIVAACRLLARLAAEGRNPPAARAVIMHTLEEEFGRARPT